MANRGNNVFCKVQPSLTNYQDFPDDYFVRDLVLHALLARIALSNNETLEFETKFNPVTQEVELCYPDAADSIFDQILGMQRGPRLKKFINWLIGSDTLETATVSAHDQNFVGATAMAIWAGATIGTIDEDTFVYFLPAGCYSNIGFNRMTGDNIGNGSLTFYLDWVYDSGNNDSFEVKVNASITDTAGNVITASNVIAPSTFNLLKGDIRETQLLSLPAGTVKAGDIISILVARNYNGHSDPQTDLVGVIGARLVIE